MDRKCEECKRPAKWIVFHGVAEEQSDTGHAVCRRHALADKALTAIEPALPRGLLFVPSVWRAKTPVI